MRQKTFEDNECKIVNETWKEMTEELAGMVGNFE
jgi:hypothetical protein